MSVYLLPDEEKVFKYLIGRKTWATPKQVSKKFSFSYSKAYNILEKFLENELADTFKSGTTKYYRIKE